MFSKLIKFYDYKLASSSTVSWSFPATFYDILHLYEGDYINGELIKITRELLLEKRIKCRGGKWKF